ncbi:uncharacterized protein PFL1_01153 [Pseudozyma flocculosa PF-1]|uniref:N-acetylgalactosaminide beta-1,3-galactosyltransferase n=1 Tax=Pseudozyma flocculosa TaxID=84751 RepID=A0A5C3EX95_9BASI|nr:uncharacterized protein PFL1_01153 [Pseudozyma flocculosa PF-1]EPQ30964.1 hypothetical protein PFL1_01153 [Pseudozyma flocculosa PF-1]SPO35799.1 uncharacterized protein PSFLO_01270 [Pseudozyma flocculosa]
MTHFYQPIPSKESSAASSPRTRQADFPSFHSSLDDLHSTAEFASRTLSPPAKREARVWKWTTVLLAIAVVCLLGSRFTTSPAAPVVASHPLDAVTELANQTGPASASTPAPSPAAAPYRLEDDMVLITKSGSATIYERFLVHLQAAPKTLYQPNTLYVSDQALDVGGVTFWDALSAVSPRIAQNDEFRRLRAESTGLMHGSQLLTNTQDKEAGWKLDKFKFLPMMAEAYRRFPGKKWFVVVEADTFVFWHQLVRFLSTQDAARHLLFGHEVLVGFDGAPNTPFAHGGSGFVASRGLLDASFGADPDFEHKWDDLLLHNGYGDAVLCKALWDTPGVNLTALSRVDEVGVDMFHGDSFRDIQFGRWDWCKPVLSYHHVSPNDVARLYDFQRRIERVLPPAPPAPRASSGSSSSSDAVGSSNGDSKDEKHAAAAAEFNHMILHSDVWHEFRPKFLKDALDRVRANDGASEEVAVRGWRSLTRDDDAHHVDALDALQCQAICRNDVECLQWTFIPNGQEEDLKPARPDLGTCRYTTDRIRIGTYRPDLPTLFTGWFVKRIDDWGVVQGCSQQRLSGPVSP